MSQLSTGICARLNLADPRDVDLFTQSHVVQFLSVRRVAPSATNPNPIDRYRVIFSDGVHFLQGMLATQLNHLVKDNAIGKNSIVAAEKVTCNFIQEKRVVIFLQIQVLSKNEEKIGDPVAINAGTDAGPSNAATAGEASTSTSTPAVQQPAVQQPVVQQPVVQQYQQQVSRQASRQQGSSGKDGRSSVYPIEGLSPYKSTWMIKARVTQKSEIKTWSNQRGEGKLFNVTLMDESGEIRGTGFNAVVDDLYDKFEEGKVYFISKARVNLAKKKFSNLQNDYELSFERNTEVEECRDANLPMVKYNFVPLSALEELPKDATCDVICIVKEVGPLGEITSKTNRTIPKRELTLVDKSGFSVRITLWGKQAEQYNVEDQPIIAFKGVKVGDFGGRSLSMVSTSTMALNPDIEESFALRGWYDSIGSSSSFRAHSSAMSGGMSSGSFNRAEIRSLLDVKESQLGMNDKAEYFSSRATIMHIKNDNVSYPACPTQGCNKKVVDVNDGWRCEKCDKNFDKPEHRYIISMAVADHSAQAWMQGFNDAGVAVFGMSANELIEIKDRDEQEYNSILHKANCNTFNFSCRAKQDTYNDQTRVRYGITRIAPLDYKEEAQALNEMLSSEWAR